MSNLLTQYIGELRLRDILTVSESSKYFGKREYHPFHRACWNADFEKLKPFLEQKDLNLNELDDNDLTPLSCAVEGWDRNESASRTSDRILLIQMLLVKGSSFNDALRLAIENDFVGAAQVILDRVKERGCSRIIYRNLLTAAAKYSSVDIVKMFLELKDYSKKNESGTFEDESAWHSESFAIYLALRRGKFNVVKLIAENSTGIFDKVPHGAEEALHWAANYGDVDLMTMLLNKGFSPNGVKVYGNNVSAKSPLHLAANSGNYQAVTLLLDRGADPLINDVNNCTTIHWAARGGNIDIVKILIGCGVGWDEEDNNNMTPLLCAAQEGHSDLVFYFQKLGADPWKQNYLGKNCLHYSAESKHNIEKTSQKQGNNFKLFSDLMQKKWDFRKDNSGNSYLHCAVSGGQLDIVRYIIESSLISIECKNKDCQTPLHCAAITGQMEMLKFLIDNKADINAPDRRGRTVLHLSVIHGNDQVVEFLLPYMADIDVKDNYGQSPLAIHLSQSNWNERLIELFLFRGANIHRGMTTDYDSVLDNSYPIEPSKILILPCLIDFGEDNCILYETFKQCFFDVDFLTCKLNQFCLNNMYKIIAANLGACFDKSDLNYPPGFFDNFRYETCKKEIQLMKNCMLNERKSVYDFLTNPLRSSATILADPLVQEKLRKVLSDKDFIVYSDLLDAKYRRAMLVKDVTDKSVRLLSQHVDIKPCLSIDCIYLLLSYLRIQDLISLSKVFKM